MTSEVERIAQQIKSAIEGRAWHGSSLLEQLAGVTAEQAASKPLGGAHSVWELVLHVEAWLKYVARALEGESMPPWEIALEDDWPPVTDTSAAAWRAAVQSIGDVGGRIREALRKFGDDDLERIVKGREYTFYFMLHGVIQHCAYHSGQMALVKKAAS